ncbi:MAG: hypothetical protein WA777_09850 [Rhodanobacter sp.]
MNIVLSNLKRALDGIYDASKFFEYTHRCLGKVAWRFNPRFQLDVQLPRLRVAAARCSPWPERALCDATVLG